MSPEMMASLKGNHKLFEGWKKRWCIFCRANGEDPWLNYYRTEEDAFSSLPIKRVNLNDCTMVEMDLSHRNYKNIFAIHLPERVYYFSAPSHIEMSEWADSLSSNLQLKNGTPSTMPGTPPTNVRYMEHKPRSSSIPSEGFYSTSPNLNRRPLPKAPNSPLPPIPDELKHHISAPSSPAHSPCLLRSPSPQFPAYTDRLPLSAATPPVPQHSPHLPPHSPHLPPHIPHLPPHSPHLSPHSSKHAQRKPPIPPLRSVSPPDIVSEVDIRPPAPPPKTINLTGLGLLEQIDGDCDCDLEESPPTPPPREAPNIPYSPPVLGTFFSEPIGSSSESVCSTHLPPTIPPRIPSPAITPPTATTTAASNTPPTMCSPRLSPGLPPFTSSPTLPRISVDPSFSYVPVSMDPPPPLPPREMDSGHQLETPHQIYTAT